MHFRCLCLLLLNFNLRTVIPAGRDLVFGHSSGQRVPVSTRFPLVPRQCYAHNHAPFAKMASADGAKWTKTIAYPECGQSTILYPSPGISVKVPWHNLPREQYMRTRCITYVAWLIVRTPQTPRSSKYLENHEKTMTSSSCCSRFVKTFKRQRNKL